MNIALWILQGVLALVFLVAGFMRAFLPTATLEEYMAWVTSLPAALLRFIGSAEMLGAIGLIVPAITGIASWLTVAADGGLAIVMLAAVGFHASRHEHRSEHRPAGPGAAHPRRSGNRRPRVLLASMGTQMQHAELDAQHTLDALIIAKV